MWLELYRIIRLCKNCTVWNLHKMPLPQRCHFQLTSIKYNEKNIHKATQTSIKANYGVFPLQCCYRAALIFPLWSLNCVFERLALFYSANSPYEPNWLDVAATDTGSSCSSADMIRHYVRVSCWIKKKIVKNKIWTNWTPLCVALPQGEMIWARH